MHRNDFMSCVVILHIPFPLFHYLWLVQPDLLLTYLLSALFFRENIRNLSRRFHDEPMNPLDNANYWIEHVIKYGDDILRSPAIDLTSWQLYLVDVAAFLLSCVMIIIIIVILIMRFIMEMINEKSHKSSLFSKKTN